MDLLSKKYKQAEEISNLKAEIKRLKECNEELTSDNLNTIQEMDNERRRVEQFKDENERLREQIEYDSRYNDMQAEIDCGERLITKYKICLQEIKAIVCGNYEIIDPQGRKDILKLITKAESEGSNV